MTMQDLHGHALSGASAQALDAFETALRELRCLSGDPLGHAEAAVAAAPEFTMAHALRAWLFLVGTDAGAVPLAREALAQARALPADAREARHLAAIGHWCAGRWRLAARTLEDLSLEHPHDLLALQLGQQLDFFTGDQRLLRDRIARALPAWSPDMPGYHALLGMYAFGLEENGDFHNAERYGRRAIELEPRDAWAQHAVVHVLEMQGRRDDGIRWMTGQAGWKQCGLLAVHNWWHLALHYLGLDDVDAALQLLDGPIDGHRPTLALELIDVSALLWRLRLRGVDVGERWVSVAERWSACAGHGWYAFNDLHAAMAFACAGRADLLEQLDATQRAAQTRADDNAGFLLAVGRAATEAVIAHVAGDHRRTVERLRDLRSHARAFGGSDAQRDLLDQTLIHSARASGQPALARGLEAERSLLARQRAGARPAVALQPAMH